MNLIDWKSWVLKRVCRSSLSVGSQAASDTVDYLNFVRLFAAVFLFNVGVDLPQTDKILSMLPTSIMVTDCKSLYDALARSESQGLGLSGKRTAIEVAGTRQQMEATGVQCKWVNSDHQLADSLTKPMASHAMKQLCTTGHWQIIFDTDFTAAKKLKRAVRNDIFKDKKASVW